MLWLAKLFLAVFEKLLCRLCQVLPRAGASPAMPVERESSPAVPFCHGCRCSAAAQPSLEGLRLLPFGPCQLRVSCVSGVGHGWGHRWTPALRRARGRLPQQPCRSETENSHEVYGGVLAFIFSSGCLDESGATLQPPLGGSSKVRGTWTSDFRSEESSGPHRPIRGLGPTCSATAGRPRHRGGRG